MLKWLYDSSVRDSVFARLVLLGTVAGLGSACADSAGPDVHLGLQVLTSVIEVGDTLRVSARTLDPANNVVGTPTVTDWTSTNPTVATIDGTGLVHALAAGTTMIRATAEGLMAETTLTVTDAQVLTLTLTQPASAIVAGETLTLVATATGRHGPITPALTWSSSAGAIASVTSMGVVTALAVGTAQITVAAQARSARATVTVDEGGIITPAGNSISAFGGAIAILAPAGAVSTPLAVRISRPGTAPVLDARFVNGSAFGLAPAASFAQPVTVQLRYSPANAPIGLTEDRLSVHNLTGQQWSAAAGSAIDTATNVASGTIVTTGIVGVRMSAPLATCVGASHREFDFWLGRWAFSAPGAFPGIDSLSSDTFGCVMDENFVDQGGTRAHGISFFVPATGLWYQTYVDTQGGRLLLRGSLVGGEMILRDPTNLRLRWTSVGANVVTQTFESTPDGGTTWVTLGVGTYGRIP